MMKIGNGNNALRIHTYKGYIIKRTGTKKYPWNIYRDGNHVGFANTIKGCKTMINDGCFE